MRQLGLYRLLRISPRPTYCDLLLLLRFCDLDEVFFVPTTTTIFFYAGFAIFFFFLFRPSFFLSFSFLSSSLLSFFSFFFLSYSLLSFFLHSFFLFSFFFLSFIFRFSLLSHPRSLFQFLSPPLFFLFFKATDHLLSLNAVASNEFAFEMIFFLAPEFALNLLS